MPEDMLLNCEVANSNSFAFAGFKELLHFGICFVEICFLRRFEDAVRMDGYRVTFYMVWSAMWRLKRMNHTFIYDTLRPMQEILEEYEHCKL